MYAGPGRQPRRAHRVGPGAAQAGVGDQGGPAGVERRARDGGRPGVLRHDGRLVQGGRRAHRQAECGSSRPARESSASRSPIAARTGSSTSRCCPASAAGPARSSSAISIRAIRPAALRLRQRDARPEGQDANREGRSMSSRCRSELALVLALGALLARRLRARAPRIRTRRRRRPRSRIRACRRCSPASR